MKPCLGVGEVCKQYGHYELGLLESAYSFLVMMLLAPGSIQDTLMQFIPLVTGLAVAILEMRWR